MVLPDGDLAEQHSVWVQKNFVKVSKLLEMFFKGMEQRVLSLLAE